MITPRQHIRHAAFPPENLSRTPAPVFREARDLELALRKRIAGEVRFDNGSRALYATDGSNYRQVPIGVVIPRDAGDVAAAIECARTFDAPVLARGCGTSLAGQCCNVALVIDMSKYMNRVLDLDPVARTARVQPGTVLDDLRDAAERHHLTFGPDPATHKHCTLGGMIGNNSCGVHSLMAGRTVDNVIALDVMTYEGMTLSVGTTTPAELEAIVNSGGRTGEIYRRLSMLAEEHAPAIRQRYPRIPRRVSGYNLDELLPERGFHVARALVGSESTCVTILEATLQLIESPPARTLVVLGFDDIYEAGDRVPEILEVHPIGLEGIDDRLISYMRRKGLHPDDLSYLPEGGGWLLVEFGGEDKKESDAYAQQLIDRAKRNHLCRSSRLFDDIRQEQKLWEIRESGLGATAMIPGMPNTWPGWEDSAVPPHRVGAYLRDLRKLFDAYHYDCSLYGHFGQGCIHVRIDFDLETAEGIRHYGEFLNEAADLVISYGGSLSGEHGDGQARAALLPKMYGAELVDAFHTFKSIWDPSWKMNPGKVVAAYRPDENLRIGESYAPQHPTTHFSFVADGGFAGATLRCVGVGACRNLQGKTMCPSFKVTREEKHSTRGRARMLDELMRGEVVGTHGWRDEAVRDSLDLCLACKGCKGDCPVNVDMATYKAEFFSHYYEGRLRPRSAYAFGLIWWWARMASLAPSLANAAMRTAPFNGLLKKVAGMAPQREFPIFARTPFTTLFPAPGSTEPSPRDVILWPDTFNNYFYPETLAAGARVLDAADKRVRVPRAPLCCGRPLYDFGMLDLAKRVLRQTLDILKADIRLGVPLVVLEPSCASVFKDELVNLFPHDEDAKRLSAQTFLLEDFLVSQTPGFRPPVVRRDSMVHLHCHHRAVFGDHAVHRLLRDMRLEGSLLDTGCCGMAGSFGFEEGEHYKVSVDVGELELLPAIRASSPGKLIITNGFSCRQQIAQRTDRRAHHLAEVIAMELEGRGSPVDAWWKTIQQEAVRRESLGRPLGVERDNPAR